MTLPDLAPSWLSDVGRVLVHLPVALAAAFYCVAGRAGYLRDSETPFYRDDLGHARRR